MRAIYILTALFLLPLISNSQGSYEKNGLSYNQNGELLDGNFTQTSEEDQTNKVYHFSNGLLDGESLIYASNGNVIEQGLYIDGQKHGKWTNWTPDGVETGEIKFNHGQRDGKWQIWDEQGILRYVMYYNVGEKVGTWLVYNETGSLQQEKNYTKML